MLGRAAYRNPALLGAVDPLLFDTPSAPWEHLHGKLRGILVSELARGTRCSA